MDPDSAILLEISTSMAMRQARLTQDGAFHHVMNRGRNRQSTFATHDDFELFEALLAKATFKFRTRVHCYCLMSNHFHLILENVDGDMSRFVQWVSSLYVQKRNQRLGLEGPLFRDRFKSTMIDSDEYFISAVKYIHRNPLAFCSPAKLSSYQYSSFPGYLHGRPKKWISTDLVFELVHDHSVRVKAMGSSSYYENDFAQLDTDLWMYLTEHCESVVMNRQIVRAFLYLARPELPPFRLLAKKTVSKKTRIAEDLLTRLFSQQDRLRLQTKTEEWLAANYGPLKPLSAPNSESE